MSTGTLPTRPVPHPRLVLALAGVAVPTYVVARVARIEDQRFYRIARGITEATPAERERIADVLGIAVDELFGDPS